MSELHTLTRHRVLALAYNKLRHAREVLETVTMPEAQADALVRVVSALREQERLLDEELKQLET